METNINNNVTNSQKPEGLPEKFWDKETSNIKIKELIEDYLSLISRDENLLENNNRNIPESFDKYEINYPNKMFERDEDVFKKFHEYGFTNKQAQLVYDLANERVVPLLNDVTRDYEERASYEKLYNHFGSEERFNIISRQVSDWAKQNVDPSIYDALAKTSDGVIALYNMMSTNEPSISKDRELEENLSLEKLKELMKDPRYWRDHDKAYVEKITKGFQKLYPEE